jgi:predicted transcriptional regulator
MVAAEEISAVVRKRANVLEVLLSSAATKPEIVQAVDSSRTTVDRALDDLLSFDLVERIDSRYQATLLGQQAFDSYQQYHQRLADLQRASSVLIACDSEAPFDPRVLEDANVEEAPPHAPERPIRTLADQVETPTSLVGTGPMLMTTYLDAVTAGAINGDLSVELVVTEPVLAEMRAMEDVPVDRLLEAETFALFKTDEQMPYALFSLATPSGRQSGIITDERGGIRGGIFNDTPQMHEWVLSQYEAYRQRATRVDP